MSDQDIGPDGLPAWGERVEVAGRLIEMALGWERDERRAASDEEQQTAEVRA